MQWVHNVTWFPAILSFSATALAYLINPDLGENKIYLTAIVIGGFWFFTIFNYFGLKTSSWFSAVGVICGTIIPGILLLVLGFSWVVNGNPIQIPFSWGALLPKINSINDMVFLTGLFLAFGGLEVSAAHVKDVKHPQKTFPRAILIAASLSWVIYAMGALAIAIMVPVENLSLLGGLMEAFQLFFENLNIGWALFPIGIMIIFGAVGELNAWIIGPVRALHASTNHGDLPPFFQRLNKHGMPAHLLLFQAIVVTIASFVFQFMPSASSAFWILSALSAQLYLIMYVLMFLAGIKLRYSHANVERPYKVPGGIVGMWIIAVMGVLSSLFAFFIGFIPPAQLEIGNIFFYEGFLLGGIFIMALIPYMIYRARHPSWKPTNR
jgi:amino acid transporter